MEGMWTKMWDPPTTSPQATDELLLVPQGLIRPNPVPEVMFAAGLQNKPSKPHTVQRDLMHGLSIPTWDGLKNLNFFVIGDPDNPTASGGTYPGPTLRMPRSVIFSAETSGKGPPPHTIHWHGIEPTPLNDGVGHCSMEIGKYTYQWQPNFMGFYFAHCHRNTMQHFEYGLYFAMIFEAPDAYFGSIASTNPDGSVVLKDLNLFPIGGGRDGKRRVACNLDDPLTGLPRFTQFPGFNRNPVDTPDPGPGPTDTQISFATDPHAMTVPFDVEALMVFDDRDSIWSDLAPSAFTTFPRHGSMPGINDEFTRNPGKNGFFAFNDYTADYWFVTGVPVPAHKGGTGTIPAGVVVPPQLMSGISGVQVSINAQTNQTILVRILNGAYNILRVTFPVDVVIIAWDGRALGVAPYAHNESYLVPAGTPTEFSVARRFDALIRPVAPINSTIKAEFINNKSQTPGDIGEQVMVTALVPFVITGPAVAPLTITAAAAANGSITPAGATSVPSGSSQTFTITPNPGFAVSALSVDGTVLPGATTHTFTNVTTDHYINAYFEPSGLKVTASAAANGSISPAGETAVAPGSNLTYTITPNPGFAVSALVVDGTVLPGATTHTFSNVTASHYINAYFAPAAALKITASAAPNGSISPAGEIAVASGSNQTYTITPNNGFTVAALVVDGTVLPGATSFTFTNVTGDHYINAYFQ
jgi:hypothetical protein